MECLPLDWSAIMASLFLPGGPRPFEISQRKWPQVESALRRHGVNYTTVIEVFKRCGLMEESILLSDRALLDWGATQLLSGCCVTVFDEAYPVRWIDILGSSAPPAVWSSGVPGARPLLSIVGCRDLIPKERSVAFSLGYEAVRSGFCVVSGAAKGADSWASQGALCAARELGIASCAVISILPHGDLSQGYGCRITPFARDAQFSGNSAMIRNALIYASSPITVIVKARFGAGGTWNGSREAIRKRLSRLVVWNWPNDQASEALVGAGAIAVDEPTQLVELAKSDNSLQPRLACAA